MSARAKKYGDDRADAVKGMIEEIAEICSSYGYSLSHEDEHGAFRVVAFDKRLEKWLLEAVDETDD